MIFFWFSNEEKLTENFHKEIEEIKHKYEQTTEQLKNDVQKINKLSMETKFTYENNKQKVCYLFPHLKKIQISVFPSND